MDPETARLFGFVMKHQSVFEAIKRAQNNPNEIEEMQRSIENMVRNERADARHSMMFWMAGLAVVGLIIGRFLA